MFWAKKLAAAAAVVLAGLTTAGVGIGLAGRPTAVAADPPKAGGLPEGWSKTVDLTSGVDGPTGTLTVTVEKGWVVARYGYGKTRKAKRWEVVLARATDPIPPKLVADAKSKLVAVEYGRYFARDNDAQALRVIRERKPTDSPPWPPAAPDEPCQVAVGSDRLRLLRSDTWVWASAGLFGTGPATPETDRKADVCLRFSHTEADDGPSGRGRMTSSSGVASAEHGRDDRPANEPARCTDDGELFVATYNAGPPSALVPAAPPKPPAPPPPKPTPPPADTSKMPPEAKKIFDELVPVCVTGTVRDGDGNPVAGAEVSKGSTVGYAATFGQTRFNGSARTDAAGRYALWFRTQPDTTVTVRSLGAEADGFVAHSEELQFDEVKAHPDKPGEWDFVLARGELLAGTVPAAVGKKHVELQVRGPSFSRTEFLDDGKFRLWVPKGRYTLTAVLAEERVPRDPKLPAETEYSHGFVIKTAAVLRDVPSGSAGLVVK